MTSLPPWTLLFSETLAPWCYPNNPANQKVFSLFTQSTERKKDGEQVLRGIIFHLFVSPKICHWCPHHGVFNDPLKLCGHDDGRNAENIFNKYFSFDKNLGFSFWWSFVTKDPRNNIFDNWNCNKTIFGLTETSRGVKFGYIRKSINTKYSRSKLAALFETQAGGYALFDTWYTSFALEHWSSVTLDQDST